MRRTCKDTPRCDLRRETFFFIVVASCTCEEKQLKPMSSVVRWLSIGCLKEHRREQAHRDTISRVFLSYRWQLRCKMSFTFTPTCWIWARRAVLLVWWFVSIGGFGAERSNPVLEKNIRQDTYLEDLFWTIMITRELSWSLEDLGFTSGPVALAPTSCPYTYIVVPFICVRTPKTGFCKWAGGHNMSCNVLFPLSPATMCRKWRKTLSFKISHRYQYEYKK